MSCVCVEFAVILGQIPVLKVERRDQSLPPQSPQRYYYMNSSARWLNVTLIFFARGTQCCRRCLAPADRIILYSIAASSLHNGYHGALIVSHLANLWRTFNYWTFHWSWNCPAAPYGPAPPYPPTSWPSSCSSCPTSGTPCRSSCSGGPHGLPHDSSSMNHPCASTSSGTPGPRTAFLSLLPEFPCHARHSYFEYCSSAFTASLPTESYMSRWWQKIAAFELQRCYCCSCYCHFHYFHGRSHKPNCN